MDPMELVQLLDGSLSAATDVRAQSEARLTHLLCTRGFALQLSAFFFSPQASEAQRQLSALLLKQLVTSFWVPNDETTYVVPETEKTQVKQALVLALQQRLELFLTSKLQTALCLIVTAIFERDWPDQWIEILPAIMAMISGQEKLRIDVAVRFLSLASGHFSSDHCCDLAASVFPHLCHVLVRTTEFSASTRSRVVRIIQSSLVMVGMEAHVGNATARQLMHEHTTQWIARFLDQLATPVETVQEYAVKIQILTTLATFVREWPKDMTDVLPQILLQVYGLLQHNARAYEQHVVLSACSEEEGYDSDGDGALIGRRAMVLAAFEVVRGAIYAPTKKTRQLVRNGLADFVYTMIGYMQITVCQQNAWQDEPNTYIADEDDASSMFGLRHAATDLLTELETVLGRPAVVAALDAAQRRLKVDTATTWRLQEAALLVIGCLAASTLDAIRTNAADVVQLLDLSTFLQTLFNVMNAESQEVYLRARALWCASRLVKGMNQVMLDAFVHVVISSLAKGQVLPLRLYACRAIGTMIRHDAAKARLQHTNVVIIDRLTTLAEQLTHETLHIALETLSVVLQESESIALESAQRAVACFLFHWSQHLNDPLICELIDAAFGALLHLDHIVLTTSVQEQVLPVLRSMLVQSGSDLGRVGHGVTTAGSALTILKTLLRPSLASRTTFSSGGVDPAMRQLGALMVHQMFEPLVTVLGVLEDEKVQNAGTDCLKWIVMFAVEPLATFTTASGQNGIDTTLAVSAKLLSPAVSEASATSVGGLITQILCKLGPRLPTATVQSILSAVGARLAATELPSLVQSLCMVFARLVHSHGRNVLDVLEHLAAPPARTSPIPAQNMLEFVLQTWIEKQQDFYGLYCLKVTTSALLTVLEWNDPRINAITVPGRAVDLTQVDGAGIQTRSKARSASNFLPHNPTVHFATKVVVLLAKTLANLADEEEEWPSSEDSEGDDDETNESSVSGSGVAPADHMQQLSDAIDGYDAGQELDQEFEAYFDPLNDVDLKTVLPRALQNIIADATFRQAVLTELSAADTEALAVSCRLELYKP